jgi:outer membrane protein OmpA-like peptidoglycan-associated protein
MNLDNATAQAESGRFNVHLGLGGAGTLNGGVGAVGHAAFDWQLSQPVALEAMLSGGAFLGISESAGFFQAALGARFRLLDDGTGHATDGGSIHGDLSIAPHLGIAILGASAAFTIDVEVGYEFSVAEPVSIGVFLRPNLFINDLGVGFAFIGGIQAQFEIDPLWRHDVDTDGDGVVDRRDRCPGTLHGASVDRRGCIPLPPTIVLEGITFAFDSATIEASSESALRRALDVLNENPTVHVRITGHTDDQGDSDYNMRLSRDRAESVAAYFVEHGVARSRLTVRGLGSTRPRDHGTDENARARNRRIELEPLESDD